MLLQTQTSLLIHDQANTSYAAQGGALTECAVVHLQVLLVDCDYALEEALDALRESIDDSIVAIDLEWTPDVVSGCYSPVALMQLASSTRVVLVRLLLHEWHAVRAGAVSQVLRLAYC